IASYVAAIPPLRRMVDSLHFAPSAREPCDATHLTILGADVDVASLADVIRSKEAAGREDRLVLPVLRRILAETDRP
ncbi:MAG: hypothetical protein QOE25_953, partial [Actinomycetota bacterium]|nr:hypothetical protein [Actinomycetota bacterium]